ncbi:SoxR reducing system RseC family protein [Hydrogenispora ethanolica]|uniref:SoxR reducing system RseC family protein n=1 Tax=Hydrogenispora ethanolica TaxID=1082276 RepID=UPI001051891E|nr:SoxR reducing system RseC family protein [Hydrogenispora ethanolica]
MDQIGKVVAIEGGTARLEIIQENLCRECGACTGCNLQHIGLELANTVGARIGDQVLIRQKFSTLGNAATLYGIPLLCFVTGLIGGIVWLKSETGGFLAGLGALAGALGLTRYLSRGLEPKIVAIQRVQE